MLRLNRIDKRRLLEVLRRAIPQPAPSRRSLRLPSVCGENASSASLLRCEPVQCRHVSTVVTSAHNSSFVDDSVLTEEDTLLQHPLDVDGRASSSTTTEGWKQLQQLRQYTKKVTSLYHYPLGTMSSHDWETALELLEFWLKDSNGNWETSPGLQPPSSSSSLGPEEGHGVKAMMADQVLQRLIREHACRSWSGSDRIGRLSALLVQVWKYWLTVHAMFPQSVLFLDHGAARWKQMMDWHARGWWGFDSNSSSEEMHDVASKLDSMVKGCLQANPGMDGSKRAIQLLVSHGNDIASLFARNPGFVIPIYLETLENSMLDADRSDVESLLSSMEYLGKMSEAWSDIRPDALAEQLVHQTMPVPSSSGASKKKLSSDQVFSRFESAAMLRQFIDVVAAAGPQERASVDEAIAHWESLSAGEQEESVGLTKEIVDYFIRTKDATTATFWLSRVALENMMEYREAAQLMGRSMKLWLNTREPHAPYRAEEIFARMEKFARHEGHVVDVEYYEALAARWIKSNDVMGLRKSLEVALSPEKPTVNLLKVAVAALRALPNPSVEVMERIHSLFHECAPNLDTSELTEIGSALLNHTPEDQESGWKLLEQMLDLGVKISPRISNSVLRRTGKNDEILRLIDKLRRVESDSGSLLLAANLLAKLDVYQQRPVEVLQELWKCALQQKNAQIGPIFEALTTALLIWGDTEPYFRVQASSLADQMVHEMLDLGVKMEAAPYSAAIRVFLRTTKRDQFEPAYKLFKRTVRASPDLELDRNTYLMLMHVASFCRFEQKKEAFELAFFALRGVRRLGEATEDTYLTLLEFVKQQTGKPASLQKAAVQIFRYVANDGLLGDALRQRLQEMASKEDWELLYVSHLVNGTEEPEEWSSKVGTQQKASS